LDRQPTDVLLPHASAPVIFELPFADLCFVFGTSQIGCRSNQFTVSPFFAVSNPTALALGPTGAIHGVRPGDGVNSLLVYVSPSTSRTLVFPAAYPGITDIMDVAMVVDSTDNPHIIYSTYYKPDVTSQHVISTYYTRRSGTAWTTTTLSTTSIPRAITDSSQPRGIDPGKTAGSVSVVVAQGVVHLAWLERAWPGPAVHREVLRHQISSSLSSTVLADVAVNRTSRQNQLQVRLGVDASGGAMMLFNGQDEFFGRWTGAGFTLTPLTTGAGVQQPQYGRLGIDGQGRPTYLRGTQLRTLSACPF
jgi:hypothetical protein